MSRTGKNVMAVVAALVVAGVVVYLTEMLGGRIAPAPEGIDVSDPEQLKAALEAGQIPFTGLALVAAGWLLGAYAGGTTAWRLSRTSGTIWIFALIFTISIFTTLAAFPHPTWMWITGLVAAPLFALGGGGQSLSVRS